MLNTLTLTNFQRIIGPLKIVFGDVTAIVGESELGKSCGFRGLESLILNAKGNKFITTGKNFCLVEAETDLGYVGWRKKKTGSATYTVRERDGEEQVFEKAEKLPDLARKILGIGEVEFGDTGMVVNLQGQFEKPFLLFESGTTVAKVLGKFTKLDEIYAAVRVANKDLLGIKQKLGIREKDLELAEEKVKKHEGLDKLDALLTALDSMAGDLEVKEAEKNNLEQALLELDEIRSNISNVDVSGVIGLVGNWPDEALQEKIRAVESFQADVRNATKILGLKLECDGLLTKARTHLKTSEGRLEAFKKEHSMCPACGRSWNA